MSAFELRPAPRGNGRTPSPPSPTASRRLSSSHPATAPPPAGARRNSSSTSPAAMPRRPSATYSQHNNQQHRRQPSLPVVGRTASHTSSTVSDLSKDAPSTAVIDHEYAGVHNSLSNTPMHTSATSKPPVFNYSRDHGVLSPAMQKATTNNTAHTAQTGVSAATSAPRPVRPKPRTANSGSKFGFVVNKDEEHALKVLGEEDDEEEQQRVPLIKRVLHSRKILLLLGLVLALIIALAVAIPVGLANAVPDRGDMGSTLPQVSPAPGKRWVGSVG